MRFEQPAWLLVLLLLVAASFTWGKWAGSHSPGNVLARRLRWLGLTLLILALSGPQLLASQPGLAVAVIVDRSASMEPLLPEVTEMVNRLLTSQADQVQIAVVSAGEQAVVERPANPLPQAPISNWQSPRYRDGTDLAGALRLAAAALPRDWARRVVLISDGRPTAGDALATVQALSAAGVRLDVIPVVPPDENDVRLTALNTPTVAVAGRPFVVEAGLFSSEPGGTAEVRLFVDDVLAASKSIKITGGQQQVGFTVTPGHSGFLALRAELTVDSGTVDSEPANNRYDTIVQVAGQPAVLLLTNDVAGPLAAVLRQQGLDVEVRGPAQRPTDLTGWSRYAAVILDNVSAVELGETAMSQLEHYVRDLGGGLVMVGGRKSFGAGGYVGTPVERALPVYMDLRGRVDLPTVALVMVIDSSGSMAGLKLDMAVEAALRTSRLLTGKDRLGVVLFTTHATVTRPLNPVTDPDELRSAFPAQAGGGTDLGAGLATAWQLLRDVDADVRHVLVLSDGVSAPFPVDEAGTRFADAGITLSTVAIGNDADIPLLRHLAKLGGGGFYEAVDPTELPTLITQDTVLATRNFIVEDSLQARRVDVETTVAAALLRGVSLPVLDGYIATSVKPRADLVLVGQHEDPILAAWQYGRGRSLAWTTDGGGEWTAAWIRSDNGHGFSRFWANALDWLLTDATMSTDTTMTSRVVPAAQGYDIQVDIQGSPPAWGTASVLRLGRAREEAVTTRQLLPVAVDKSRATVPVSEPGVYVVSASTRSGDGWSTVVAVPYPAEYRPVPADPDYLAGLAHLTGGGVLADISEALERDVPSPRDYLPLWPYLVGAAAILLPCDVAARRLAIRGFSRPAASTATSAAARSEAHPDDEGTPAIAGPPHRPSPPGTSPSGTAARLLAARERTRSREVERARRRLGAG